MIDSIKAFQTWPTPLELEPNEQAPLWLKDLFGFNKPGAGYTPSEEYLDILQGRDRYVRYREEQSVPNPAYMELFE